MKTGWLSQIVLSEPDPDRPDYPPLTETERILLKVIANGLYVSESSIQWAFWNATRKGEKDAFRKVLKILEHKPVTVVWK